MKTHATPATPTRTHPGGRAAQAPRRPLPRPSSPHPQRQSAQVREILDTPGVQPKLIVGPPDDTYEREADRVADQVMRMPEPDRIQRACSECEEELRRQPVEELEEEELRTKRSAGGEASPLIESDLESRVRALRGGGRPLPESARAFFEPRFGHDFGGVRVHTDRRSKELARSIDARAFTLGQDVVFGRGEYRPRTSTGLNLLAHELTHVIQQRGNVDGIGRRRRAALELAGRPVESARNRMAIRREITEESIRRGDFFSTDCGWVDAGHANPGDARRLIAHVREASQRIGRREARMSRTLAGEPAPTIPESSCSAAYEEDEAAQSHMEVPVMETNEHPSGAVDIVLGGFGVNSSATDKFGPMLDLVVQSHAAWETTRGRSFRLEVSGFGDCIDSDETNDRLRMERAATISLELARRGIQVEVDLSHGINEYLASNDTRAGRKKNRGVLIRFVPRVRPESFTTETAESREPLTDIQVSAVTPTVALNRSLTEDEVLSVALTIFSAQSMAFENLQQWRDVIPFSPPSSSFAEEDLPSNLIGFYRSARGFSFQEVRTLCDAWSQARSIAHLGGYTFSRNRSFSPPSLPPGGAWPAEFQTITPAPFDSEAFQILNLRLETPLVTINCSIDPRTNSLQCP